MNKFRTSILFLAFLAVVSGSCGFYKVCDVVPITLPDGGLEDLQGNLPLFWNISWLKADGTVGRRRVREGASLSLPIPRERPVVVTASPVTPHLPFPFQVRPAGFVSAADNPIPAELLVTWERGFAADFLLKLADSGISPEVINVRKFLEVIEIRLGRRTWDQDMAKLSSELLSGDLWSYSFRISELLDVVLPLQPGYWYSEYPPDQPLYSGNGSWSGELAIGLHNFVCPTDGSVVSVSINERGDVSVFQ